MFKSEVHVKKNLKTIRIQSGYRSHVKSVRELIYAQTSVNGKAQTHKKV